MSLQDTQLNTISCIFLKNKISSIPRGHFAMLSTFIRVPFVIKIVFCVFFCVAA